MKQPRVTEMKEDTISRIHSMTKPIDRMLIAQALANRLALMSDDAKFLSYDCKVI